MGIIVVAARSWTYFRGDQPGRVVFLYSPAGAGRLVEGMLERPAQGDLKKQLEEFCWEVPGPNPL